jgi:hypothetical protein
VFLPGLNKKVGNKKFEEEWKPVNAMGRLTRNRMPARPATMA